MDIALQNCHLVHHEAVDLAARRERSDNAEGDPHFTQSPALNIGSGLEEVVGRDAAPAPLVHQDQTEFVIETLSAVIQYYRTIGNIWDVHQTSTARLGHHFR